MTAPTIDTIQTYYNDRVAGKLRDFTEINPRIEAAIELLAEWAPRNPKGILEIGIGIGATSWRMARAWPGAQVTGVDISPTSVEVANTCFRLPNLSYRAGIVNESFLSGQYDLVLMMDVYEHIPLADRPTIHAAIKAHLSDECRIVLTVPTPALQRAARDIPGGLQPVDEDIGLDEINRFARETDTQLLYFRQVGIWEYGDYAHLVFGRYQSLAKVGDRPPTDLSVSARLKRWLKGEAVSSGEKNLDYFGYDVGRRRAHNVPEGLMVSQAERARIASEWFKNHKDNGPAK